MSWNVAGLVANAASREKGLELLAHDLMEERRFGLPRCVGSRRRAVMSARDVGARRRFGHRPWRTCELRAGRKSTSRASRRHVQPTP